MISFILISSAVMVSAMAIALVLSMHGDPEHFYESF